MFKDFIHKITDFKSDILGTVLFDASIVFVILTLGSLPLFTTREGFTIITNILSIFTCVFIFLFVLLRGKFYLNYYVFFIMLFLIYATISTLIGSKQFSTLKSVFTLYLLCLFIFQFCANTKLEFFVLMCLLLGIISLMFFFLIDSAPILIETLKNKTSIGRLGDKYGNLNYIGESFSLGSILFICIALYKKRFYLFLLIPAAIATLCVFLTGSRGALITNSVGILLAISFLFPKKRKWIYFIALVAFIGIVYLLLQLPIFSNIADGFNKAIAAIFERSNEDMSSFRRLEMLKDGINAFLKNVIFGYGAYGFFTVTSFGTYSHNSIVELLCCFGLIGLFLFYTPFVFQFINLAKDKTKDHLFYKMILICFALAFLVFGAFFFVLYTQKLLILTICILFSFDFDINRENEKTLMFYIAAKKKRVKKHVKAFSIKKIALFIDCSHL